jgi:hypothetical protein
VLGDIGSAIGDAATWAWEHPVEAGGSALGGISLATGFGAIAAPAIFEGFSTVGLGATSVVTGIGARAIDGQTCLRHASPLTNPSCYGAAAGTIGAVAGGGGLLGDAGILGESAGVSRGLNLAALGLGSAGLTIDGLTPLNDFSGLNYRGPNYQTCAIAPA